MLRELRIVSAAMVGWIPYCRRFSDAPSPYAAYGSKSPKHRRLFAILFRTGNPSPPHDLFASDTNLAKFIRSKKYRGLVKLSDITVSYPDHGQATVTMGPMLGKAEVGYTPFELKVFGTSFALWHSKGDGSPREPSVIWRGSDVHISHEVAFRVSWLGLEAGRIISGYRLPFVWMTIDYGIASNGEVIVSLSGSFVPSQRAYLWTCDEANSVLVKSGDDVLHVGTSPVVAHEHDMGKNTHSEISSIFATHAVRANGNYYRRFDIGP